MSDDGGNTKNANKAMFVKVGVVALVAAGTLAGYSMLRHWNSPRQKVVALAKSFVSVSEASAAPVAQKASNGARILNHAYGGDYIGGKMPKETTSLTNKEREVLIRNGHPHWGSSLFEIPNVNIGVSSVEIEGAFNKFVLDLLKIEKYTGALAEKMKSLGVHAIKGSDISETERVTRKIYENIRLASIKSNNGDLAHDKLKNDMAGVKGRTNSLWGSHHGSDSITVKMVTDKVTGKSRVSYLDGADAPGFVLITGNIRGQQRREIQKLFAVQFNPQTFSWTIFKNADINANTVSETKEAKEMIITLYPDTVDLVESAAKRILRESPYNIKPRLINKMNWRKE